MRAILTALFCLIGLGAPLDAAVRPVCGTPALPDRSPFPHPATKLQSGPLLLGQQVVLPAFSFQLIGGGPYQTTATVRHVGTHCYILVEDDVWPSRVSAADVTRIAAAFDDATPADPARGIYEIEKDLFGPAPDVDADPKILIFLLDILDSPITGTTFVGYFDTRNQSAPTSREIVYIDVNPLELDSPLAHATLAHEFQHVVHWNADPDEEKWIDEGCSEYAELACGYRAVDTTAAEAFLAESGANTGLTRWDDAPWEFDQVYLWTTYLVQRVGETGLRALVADAANGIESVRALLASRGGDLTFESLYADWTAALFFDEPGVLGLEAIDLASIRRDTIQVPSLGSERLVRLWGIDYLAVDAPGETVAADITSLGDNALSVVVLARGGESVVVGRAAVPAGGTRRVTIHAADVAAFAVTGVSGTGEAYRYSTLALPAGGPAAADLDADGLVGFSDFVVFAAGFGKSAADRSYDPTLDFDGDREVAFPDFVAFARVFGG